MSCRKKDDVRINRRDDDRQVLYNATRHFRGARGIGQRRSNTEGCRLEKDHSRCASHRECSIEGCVVFVVVDTMWAKENGNSEMGMKVVDFFFCSFRQGNTIWSSSFFFFLCLNIFLCDWLYILLLTVVIMLCCYDFVCSFMIFIIGVLMMDVLWRFYEDIVVMVRVVVVEKWCLGY